MSPKLLLWPMVVHVLLTLALFIRLSVVKSRARRAGLVDLEAAALDNDAWPTGVRKVANNIRNQFQVPVLFYVIVFALIELGAVDLPVVALAWAFVASRIAHAFVHTTSNVVPIRRRIFSFGTVCVLAMAVLLVRALVR
jgi:hypothetical protein